MDLLYGMGGTQPAGGGGAGFIFYFILLFLIFYFLLIQPQRRKEKEHRQMLASLKKGDKVVTLGGIHGVVVNIKDKTVVLKVDDNTRIEFSKSAISYKIG